MAERGLKPVKADLTPDPLSTVVERGGPINAYPLFTFIERGVAINAQPLFTFVERGFFIPGMMRALIDCG